MYERQAGSEGAPAAGVRLPGRRRTAVARVIEFYIPDRFKRKVKWVPPDARGKVIPFPPLPEKKSA
jgi:hypothetical protein